MSGQKQRLTFISYSRADSEFALGLARELRSSGFYIWLDQLDIPTGIRWDDAVEKALSECEIFMVILTPESIASNNVKDEVGYAIDSNKRILPVLLENAVLPFRLRRFQYVDFTRKSYDDGIEAAKQLLRKLLNEPTSSVSWTLSDGNKQETTSPSDSQNQPLNNESSGQERANVIQRAREKERLERQGQVAPLLTTHGKVTSNPVANKPLRKYLPITAGAGLFSIVCLIAAWMLGRNLFIRQSTSNPFDVTETITSLPEATSTVEQPLLPTTPQGINSEQPIQILWLGDCDPRNDPEFCKITSDIKVFDQFYGAITTLDADLSYKLPTSKDGLVSYDVVIADFCGAASEENVIGWLKSYVTSGGSVIALGDNFCQGVGPINGEWVSSAQAASLFTQDWGISFTNDDDNSLQWADPVLVHPLTQNITKIYAFRHAYLDVQSPSQVILKMGDKPFVALYDQTGSVIAIPDIGFHWGTDFRQEINDSDNFTFWRNMFNWLAEQSRNKRN